MFEKLTRLTTKHITFDLKKDDLTIMKVLRNGSNYEFKLNLKDIETKSLLNEVEQFLEFEKDFILSYLNASNENEGVFQLSSEIKNIRFVMVENPIKGHGCTFVIRFM